MDPVQFYKCLSDETRLRCLLLVEREAELCVCELMQALDAIQPKVSRHLAHLRQSGLLLDRKQGQWVFYRINPALPVWVKSVLQATSEANRAFLKKNLANLSRMNDRPDRAANYC